MTYRLSDYEVELLLSFYRDIKKYEELLEKEIRDKHYGVDSQIYAAFKLSRVSESTKISYIRDYCSMIKKAMQSWKDAKDDKEYRVYRAIQLIYIGKNNRSYMYAERQIGCPRGELRRICLNKGITIFKYYLVKQLKKRNYTQSESGALMVDEDYDFEQGRNLELLFYVTANIARKYREYFKNADSVGKAANSNIKTISHNKIEYKEVS